MSGQFAGSKSLDERRRRRLASDDSNSQSAKTHNEADASRPLPARPPSEQFPLRRIISRAQWKLALSLFGVTCVATLILALGHLPRFAGGAYGPGVERLAADHAARLTTVVIGGLLLAAAQLSWLIRWARSRSLRDFRARYRIWWWSAAALAISGLSILIDAPAALAATIAWATNWPPILGGLAAYELAPALVAIVLLFPGLQRDMRGCRTSRAFLFMATLIFLAAGGATLASDSFVNLMRNAIPQVAPQLVIQSLWLAGTINLFAAFLFHARFVIYESVEPPASAKDTRQKQTAAPTEKAVAKARSSTSQSANQKPTPQSSPAAKSQPIAKPAAQTPPAKPEVQASEPPVISKATPDDRWAEIGTIEVDGRVIRLDGPEDPMKGLSKRERRKVRKAIKDHQRNGGEEY